MVLSFVTVNEHVSDSRQKNTVPRLILQFKLNTKEREKKSSPSVKFSSNVFRDGTTALLFFYRCFFFFVYAATATCMHVALY